MTSGDPSSARPAGSSGSVRITSTPGVASSVPPLAAALPPRGEHGPASQVPEVPTFGHGGHGVRVLPHGRARSVAVLGVGYVGLPTAAVLAHLGHQVTCADVDEDRIAQLATGSVPIVEDHLEELVREGLDAGRLRFVTDVARAVTGCEFVFLCVPTPQGEDGSADLSYVEAAAAAIGPHLEPGSVVVNKSTVPVGSTLVVERVLGRHDVSVVSNPEFLREGTAVQDFLHPDRIIFGANSSRGLDALREIFQPLIDRGYAIFSMSRQSAELTKFASNAMLAMRVSFINELSLLASAIGADIESVRVGIGTDKRIGPSFLKAGVGYGGSCFPKDVAALEHQMRQVGIEPCLVAGVEKVNQRQKLLFAQRVLAALQGVQHPQVALWGLAFKPDTDDMRESPSIPIARTLAAGGVALRVYDPQAMDNARKILGDAVQWSRDVEDCTRGADAIALVTDWPIFITQNWARMAAIMRGKHVFDGRNCLASGKVAAAGLYYHAVGRPELAPGAGRPGSMGVIPSG